MTTTRVPREGLAPSPLDGLEASVQREIAARREPSGVLVQIYRGAIPGPTPQARRDRLAGYLDQLVTLGLTGVVFHGFPSELLSAWDGLAHLASERGLQALASWGLDGKATTPAVKGDLIGQVLARPTCAAGLLDAEGQWDTDAGPADDMDEAGALALGRAIRARAPHALVGDQPWYAIDSHGSVRRTAKPIDQGGVFGGFPVDEFAVTCTWGRFRQAYIYNHLGPSCGYASTFARMDREWATITPALRAAGLERPLRVTLQGYRWKLHELVDALLTRCVLPQVPLVMWSEPFPDQGALQAIRAVTFLKREGYVASVARRTVLAFQVDYNRQAPETKRLAEDGWWGPATHAAAGLP